jgi:hypothetical protein
LVGSELPGDSSGVGEVTPMSGFNLLVVSECSLAGSDASSLVMTIESPPVLRRGCHLILQLTIAWSIKGAARSSASMASSDRVADFLGTVGVPLDAVADKSWSIAMELVGEKLHLRGDGQTKLVHDRLELRNLSSLQSTRPH